MAKYIAHSSIDERGKATGGVAGDQTSKEICIRTMYYKPWNMVLRIENEKVREQFANNMIDLAYNNNVGYDQGQRNTLLTQAKKVDFDFSKIDTKCECDCSSAITICVLGAIYKVLGKDAYEKAYAVLVVQGNCATTSTLKSRMLKLTVVGIKVTVFTSRSYTASDSNAVFGDIYNKSGSHVVCYIDDGKKVTPSSTEVVKPPTKKVESAKHISSKLAGTYKTTANLNLRTSAGKKADNSILVMPKGTTVKNFGYYNTVGSVKWLLVQVTIKGTTYTGYCSSEYIAK